jgi:ABC-type polysaccharide/polyol phosphate transport system ATPase subunit
MRESVALYGFGSSFSETLSQPRDVDILILHERIDSSSIDFAIHCKASLAQLVPNSHITILSESEERELNFVQRCKATFLARLTNIGSPAKLVKIAVRLNLLCGFTN